MDGGPDVCKKLVLKDVLTPLIALLNEVCHLQYDGIRAGLWPRKLNNTPCRVNWCHSVEQQIITCSLVDTCK